jgi:hypothetical protein
MRLNELIKEFKIYMSNDEARVFDECKSLRPLRSFTERDQVIIEGMIRKSLVSKISRNGLIMVLANEL